MTTYINRPSILNVAQHAFKGVCRRQHHRSLIAFCTAILAVGCGGGALSTPPVFGRELTAEPIADSFQLVCSDDAISSLSVSLLTLNTQTPESVVGVVIDWESRDRSRQVQEKALVFDDGKSIDSCPAKLFQGMNGSSTIPCLSQSPIKLLPKREPYQAFPFTVTEELREIQGEIDEQATAAFAAAQGGTPKERSQEHDCVWAIKKNGALAIRCEVYGPRDDATLLEILDRPDRTIREWKAQAKVTEISYRRMPPRIVSVLLHFNGSDLTLSLPDGRTLRAHPDRLALQGIRHDVEEHVREILTTLLRGSTLRQCWEPLEE